MKAVAILPLLVLGTSAFNSTEYLTGFSQQFGFNYNQTQDASNCVNEIQSLAGQLIQTVQANEGNLEGFALEVVPMIVNVKAQLAAACEPIATDFATVILEKTGTQNLEGVVQNNAMTYFPQVLQNIGKYLQYMTTDQSLEAGQTEALILQILFGVEQPTVLPVPQATKYVAFNETAFLNEYLTSMFNTIGIKDVNIPSIVQCAQQIQNFTTDLITLHQEMPTMNLDDKINAVKGFVIDVTSTIQDCEGVVQFQEMMFDKIYPAFSQDKVGFLFQAFENFALNAPQYVQNSQQADVDIIEGEYTLAGQLQGENANFIYAGLVNFADYTN